jgi:hypothetical protein
LYFQSIICILTLLILLFFHRLTSQKNGAGHPKSKQRSLCSKGFRGFFLKIEKSAENRKKGRIAPFLFLEVVMIATGKLMRSIGRLLNMF